MDITTVLATNYVTDADVSGELVSLPYTVESYKSSVISISAGEWNSDETELVSWLSVGSEVDWTVTFTESSGVEVYGASVPYDHTPEEEDD